MIIILEEIDKTINDIEEISIEICNKQDIKENNINKEKMPPSPSICPEHPICFYYWINKWRAKEIIINNRIYHLIGNYVYLSDGRSYIGTYDKTYPEDIQTVAIDPDEITYLCCPCFIRKQLKYIDNLEK